MEGSWIQCVSSDCSEDVRVLNEVYISSATCSNNNNNCDNNNNNNNNNNN